MFLYSRFWLFPHFSDLSFLARPWLSSLFAFHPNNHRNKKNVFNDHQLIRDENFLHLSRLSNSHYYNQSILFQNLTTAKGEYFWGKSLLKVETANFIAIDLVYFMGSMKNYCHYLVHKTTSILFNPSWLG